MPSMLLGSPFTQTRSDSVNICEFNSVTEQKYNHNLRFEKCSLSPILEWKRILLHQFWWWSSGRQVERFAAWCQWSNFLETTVLAKSGLKERILLFWVRMVSEIEQPFEKNQDVFAFFHCTQCKNEILRWVLLPKSSNEVWCSRCWRMWGASVMTEAGQTPQIDCKCLAVRNIETHFWSL